MFVVGDNKRERFNLIFIYVFYILSLMATKKRVIGVKPSKTKKKVIKVVNKKAEKKI